MRVELLAHTPDLERLISASAKLCYSKTGLDGLMHTTDEQVDKFLNKLMSLGHESPIEHATFTFAIEGVSRVLTHQLVRHRLASFSQQSQRYVKLDQFEYIIPKEIEENYRAKQAFIWAMEESQDAYDNLVEILMDNGRTEKQAIEDARYVFPNACETKIIVTMNARTLMNFFNHRCCNRAQEEIKDLSDIMLAEVKKVAPTLFKYAGAPCTHGKCPEGKMTCGNPRK